MKQLHQLFIFAMIASPLFCLGSDIESTKASTLRFLNALGAKKQKEIQIVIPNIPNQSGLFISLATYEQGSPQRFDIPLEDTSSQLHGVSPLGTPERKKTTGTQKQCDYPVYYLRSKSPKNHGVSPLGDHGVTPPPSPERPRK